MGTFVDGAAGGMTGGPAMRVSEPVATPHVDSPMSGLETMRALQSGTVDRPGIAQLLGMRIEQVDEGRVVFGADVRADFANPLGTVHGGILSTLLDSAMACAVFTTLPPRTSYTTVDLTVSFVRAVPLDARHLRAEGTVIHSGGRIATAQGRLTDEEGNLVAHGTTTCLVRRPPANGART